MSSLLSLDQLFAIAEAAPVLDKAEAELRAKGKGDVADRLVKWQQDAGLAVDNEFNGTLSEPAPGPATAALIKAYEPVTNTRSTAVLNDVYTGLDKGETQNNVLGVLRELARLNVQSLGGDAPKMQHG